MAKNCEFEIQFFESILEKNPSYTEVIEILSSLYTQAGEVDKGLKMDKKLVKLLPKNPIAHYNLACSLALKARKADAVRALRHAIDLGYDDIAWMLEDPDLAVLHSYKPFNELILELEETLD